VIVSARETPIGAPDVLNPGDRVDQFEVLRPLGQGGSSASYLARDRTTGERVVLKFPAPGIAEDASAASRFQREAEIARRLRHPNIQGAARASTERDAAYLALEYIEGRSLRAWLESDTPPTLEQSVEIALQIARAMAYAHGRDVYHRDLKPENVIVLPDGTIKVIDFGSARMAGLRRLTFRLRGEASGTPDYMAPEQVQGGRGDARTDIYALGAMLYELLTGRVPFEGDNPQAVMFQQINSEPPLPTRFNPRISPALEAIVLRALRKRPADRYQSADELARDLAAFRDTGEAHVAGVRPQGRWTARVVQRLRRP
jgi:serine/threonine-protein kinase